MTPEQHVTLPARAQKMRDTEHALGLDITVAEMAESTRAAEKADAACGCEPAQIVRSLVFRGAASEKPLLALVSGANRANEKGVGAEVMEVT